MNFLLNSNPAFLVIPVDNKEYVFYNSLQHRASRLNLLEMKILDMYYTYQDKKYIISMFEGDNKNFIVDALDKIEEQKLLLCEDIKDTDSYEHVLPSSFFFHLTYKCNLACTYCYNKSIRRNHLSTMTQFQWEKIIDKVAPHARAITLTGGEFFLYPGLIGLLQYIKQKCPEAMISAISNGMHDFSKEDFADAFEYISSISFSCDSISREGERKGFDPERYKNNILWVKENFPNVHVSVATTVTSLNLDDLPEIQTFCQEHGCNQSRVIMIPENASEIELMPTAKGQVKLISKGTAAKNKRMEAASLNCGAGRSICSIDPFGNVYPCQSLHHAEFLMGNLLTDRIEDLLFFGKDGRRLKNVNDFAMCSKCKVKYICGGGCPATGYKFYGNKIKPNHLLCRMNYITSINKLKSLDNRL